MSNEENDLLPERYIGVASPGIRENYSVERIRKGHGVCEDLTTDEIFELPLSVMRTLDLKGKPLDFKHHGVTIGRVERSWLDNGRDLCAEFRLNKNPLARQVRAAIDNGDLLGLSLTTEEEVDRRTLDVSVTPIHLAVCTSGARPKTWITGKIDAEGHKWRCVHASAEKSGAICHCCSFAVRVVRASADSMSTNPATPAPAPTPSTPASSSTPSTASTGASSSSSSSTSSVSTSSAASENSNSTSSLSTSSASTATAPASTQQTPPPPTMNQQQPAAPATTTPAHVPSAALPPPPALPSWGYQSQYASPPSSGFGQQAPPAPMYPPYFGGYGGYPSPYYGMPQYYPPPPPPAAMSASLASFAPSSSASAPAASTSSSAASASGAEGKEPRHAESSVSKSLEHDLLKTMQEQIQMLYEQVASGGIKKKEKEKSPANPLVNMSGAWEEERLPKALGLSEKEGPEAVLVKASREFLNANSDKLLDVDVDGQWVKLRMPENISIDPSVYGPPTWVSMESLAIENHMRTGLDFDTVVFGTPKTTGEGFSTQVEANSLKYSM